MKKLSENEMKALIQLCINEYKGEHGKVIEVKEWHELKKFVCKNVELTLYTKGDVLGVCIRGSDDWKDWSQNMDCESLQTPYGNVHKGFYEDNLILMKMIGGYLHDHDNILIFGHSKGASQAEMLTLYIHTEKVFDFTKKVIECKAFAPAKTMDSEAVRVIQKNLEVVINGEDYICKLPQWKFTHGKNIKRIGKRNILMNIPFLRLLALTDHEPERYLKNYKD